MIARSRFWRYGALGTLALGGSLATSAVAQPRQDAGVDDGASCMSEEPLECADRCPTFDTCFISGDDARLYYRVDDQRFDCDDLDCRAASERLGDYCCERGEFAPEGGDGCSCSLIGARERGGPASVPGSLAALAACFGVGIALCMRRRAPERLG